MDAPPDPHFNLVSEPWIPVTMIDGMQEEVSLRELFGSAHRIRDVMGDIPQQTLPMLRLFEAILYRSYGRVPEEEDADFTEPAMLDGWKAVWDAGCFDDGLIDEYLDEFQDRFDLFGEHPFLQVPNLEYTSRDKMFDSIGEMLADVPKRAKFLFSMRSKDAPNSISYAEAARWLLFYQAYDCAGIKTPVVGNSHALKGKVYAPKGLPSTGWLGCIGGTYLEGSNLFETLLLNWVMYDDAAKPLFGNPSDIPCWESSGDSRDYIIQNPRGPAQLGGWQSRRVRLVPSERGGSVVGLISCYGDIPRPTEMPGVEQMTSWRKSETQQKTLGTPYVPWMPRSHDCSRAIWRGLEAIISRGDTSSGDLRPGVVRWLENLRAQGVEGLPPAVTVHAQGVEYGSQSSVMVRAMDDRMDLGSALLRNDSPAVGATTDVISRTDQAVFQLVVFVRSVEHSQGDMSRDRDPQGQRVGDDVREVAYSQLDDLFRSRIAHFSDEQPVDAYCTEWLTEVHRVLLAIARSYLAGSDVSFFERRGSTSVAEAESRLRWKLQKILLGDSRADGQHKGGTR